MIPLGKVVTDTESWTEQCLLENRAELNLDLWERILSWTKPNWIYNSERELELNWILKSGNLQRSDATSLVTNNSTGLGYCTAQKDKSKFEFTAVGSNFTCVLMVVLLSSWIFYGHFNGMVTHYQSCCYAVRMFPVMIEYRSVLPMPRGKIVEAVQLLYNLCCVVTGWFGKVSTTEILTWKKGLREHLRPL